MKKLVEVLRDHDAHAAGSRKILPADEADALAGRGIVRIVRDMTEAAPEPPSPEPPPPVADDAPKPARRR